MKTIRLLILLILGITYQVQAQTADEIIANYFENTGGLENWKKITSMKTTASINQQGMEIPIEIFQTSSGKEMTTINFQGKTIKQGVFNGEILWSTNFLTQKAEKHPQEDADNKKLEMNDFPSEFIDYKSKGYSLEYLGKENIGGTEMFKLKLTKEQVTIKEQKEDNVVYYFFDADSYALLILQTAIKDGPAKGKMSEVTFSDYDEVDGLYFPFSMTQGIKDGQSQPLKIVSIEINPTIDEKEFEFPSEN